MHRLAKNRRSDPPLSLAPAQLQRRMAEIGPVWAEDIEKHARIVFDAYAPLLRSASHDGVLITRDLAYGSHPRQRLDVYRSSSQSSVEIPVVMFVHGGAFVRGDRNVTPEIYGNVPRWFSRNNCVGVNLGYRLAPEASYPEAARDIECAVAWLRDNIQSFGGDPSRLFLVGHSSGGTHVASYVFDRNARESSGPLISGQILISARVRADALPQNPNAEGVRAYFGSDVSQFHARSPITHAPGSSIPTMIIVAEFESPLIDVYGLDLFHCMSNVAPRELRFVRMERHNHASIIAHFNTDEGILGAQILDFMNAVSRFHSTKSGTSSSAEIYET